MKQVMGKMGQFLRDEEGQGMVEYGLIIALISVVAIGALVLLGPKIAGFFTGASTALDGATTPAP